VTAAGDPHPRGPRGWGARGPRAGTERVGRVPTTRPLGTRVPVAQVHDVPRDELESRDLSPTGPAVRRWGPSPLPPGPEAAESGRCAHGLHGRSTNDLDDEGRCATSGTSDQAKGRVKEAAGALTGDKDLEAEGTTDRIVGDVKEKVEDVKDKGEDAIDKVKDALHKK
jgi:uncharacterized protein YjbJ (UPF0337 family)